MRVVSMLGLALVAALGVACGSGAESAAKGDGAKVATVADRTITRAELEDHVRPKLIEVETQRYETLREGLDEMIASDLEEREAKARGIDPVQLEQQEIAAKSPDPTDDEVQKLYDDNKAQLGGQTLEQIKPRIVAYLKEQKSEARRAAFMAELKQKYKT